ncbi:hypothetical protein B0H12DRAFT_253426 [Mycena haematopus]|nr:hypothetical protein B0H12DRAFT_253426 [Mycena haematopus]
MLEETRKKLGLEKKKKKRTKIAFAHSCLVSCRLEFVHFGTGLFQGTSSSPSVACRSALLEGP